MTVTYGNKIPTAFDWTAAQEDRLSVLWIEGQSARQISVEFAGEPNAPSRSAIIGKVHRLGLNKFSNGRIPVKSTPPTPPHATWARPRKSVMRKQRSIAFDRMLGPQLEADADPVATTEPPAEFLGLAFADLTPDMCRYARGDAPPYKFCGQPVAVVAVRNSIDGEIHERKHRWCPDCYRIVYKPARPDTRRPYIDRAWKPK